MLFGNKGKHSSERHITHYKKIPVDGEIRRNKCYCINNHNVIQQNSGEKIPEIQRE